MPDNIKPKKKEKSPKKKTNPPGIAAFVTRERANEGIKIPLDTAEGKRSEHWLHIYGVDSDVHLKAKHAHSIKLAEAVAINDEDERLKITEDALCTMFVPLVKDWSFKDPDLMPEGEALPCTPENVFNFLKEAPQIREKIDAIVSNRSIFYAYQKRKS